MMKKYIYISVISLLLMSCGGGDDSSPAPIPVNTAPTIPILVTPTNNKLCIDNSVSFQWDLSADSNNDPITYQIQVAKDIQFAQIVKTLEGSTNSQTISLDKGIAYYWRVKATDNKSLSSNYSSTYNFYTEGVATINHLPFSPELVQPALNSLINPGTATLKWNANDVDVNDVLVYDVYFGTDNLPATKVGSNITTNTVDVSVATSKKYYWKVIVKDNKGGETVGQIWSFSSN
jgi:uncharacterized protein (DUF427 family)